MKILYGHFTVAKFQFYLQENGSKRKTGEEFHSLMIDDL